MEAVLGFNLELQESGSTRGSELENLRSIGCKSEFLDVKV
jgi:hypothetical protein